MSGKQATIAEQANTPAQGAEGVAKNKAVEQVDFAAHIAKLLETYDLVLVSNASVLESNALVIKSNESLEALLTKIIEAGPVQAESNQAVVDAIGQFKDSSVDFVKELVGKFSGTASLGEFKQSVQEVTEISLDDSYIVAEGKSFRDPKDFTKEYVAGDNVDHLDPAVLIRLLNQGLIEGE
ncbi:hypothetical protein WAE58_21760 [Pedobacter panaciterrae]|uniref:Uncharacterized protein n=1 Tax=Pedobacter panaciterrae TaxID=363849 RepID=A0ABU8NUD7_9SPHI